MLTERIAEWWAERWVKKKLSKVPNRITEADLCQLEHPKNGVISLRSDGFVLHAPTLISELSWGEIRSVFSYKRDLLTTDLICLGFGRGNDQPMVETHEEMSGFLKLRREVEQRLPGLSEAFNRWLLSSPAFDRTVVCIWEKSGA
jgi:hypothetical protein